MGGMGGMGAAGGMGGMGGEPGTCSRLQWHVLCTVCFLQD
jgi:hypothetical protein